MSWTEIESYRQLEQEYEREREQFVAEEKAYRDAIESGNGDASVLRGQYADLAAKRIALEHKFEALRQMRNNLAHKRDEVSRALVI